MAIRTGQRIPDLLDLMGLPREWPEVFDEMVDLLQPSDTQEEIDWDAKFSELRR